MHKKEANSVLIDSLHFFPQYTPYLSNNPDCPSPRPVRRLINGRELDGGALSVVDGIALEAVGCAGSHGEGCAALERTRLAAVDGLAPPQVHDAAVVCGDA